MSESDGPGQDTVAQRRRLLCRHNHAIIVGLRVGVRLDASARPVPADKPVSSHDNFLSLEMATSSRLKIWFAAIGAITVLLWAMMLSSMAFKHQKGEKCEEHQLFVEINANVVQTVRRKALEYNWVLTLCRWSHPKERN